MSAFGRLWEIVIRNFGLAQRQIFSETRIIGDFQDSSRSQLLFWLGALLNLVEIRNVNAEPPRPSHF
jgi:hypothetical protein